MQNQNASDQGGIERMASAGTRVEAGREKWLRVAVGDDEGA